MRGKHIEPSVTETRFSCPYCGTLTVQHWYYLYVNKITDKDEKRITPNINTKKDIEEYKSIFNDLPKTPLYIKEINKLKKNLTGKFCLDFNDNKQYMNAALTNLTISVCDECNEAAIWHRDRLMHPATYTCHPAHEDMPDHIVTDYNEARAIIDFSARGAAALARLCIEKLCSHLLKKDVGSIDKAIGQLVKDGLDERIQKNSI